MLGDELYPVVIYLGGRIDGCDKVFNQVFLAAQLHTGVHGLADVNKDFFILAVAIVILGNQHGHFTTGKVWRTGEERRYEINISSASLNQECAFLAGVLVHEMVHEYCAEHGIKDTSNNGVYHNKNFRHIAETHGLEVEHHPKYGWTITSPGLELLDFVEEQGWQDFQMVESLNLLDVLGTLPKGGNSSAGAETRTKKPSSTRKYICPKCGNSCRATKVINLICGDCMEKMVVAE